MRRPTLRRMPAPKHLLCLYPWMEIGGADKFNLDLLGCLRSRGWVSTVVTTLPSRHPWRANFERVADEVLDLAQEKPEDRPTRLVEWARQRQLTAALLSHSGASYRLLPFLRAHLPHLPFVDYCHMEELNWDNGGFPRMSLHQSAHLDLQVVSSEHLKTWLCAGGAAADRIEVCTTNIDLSNWNPAAHDRAQLRQALEIPDTAPVVLYAGRLVPQKQPRLALSVMRQVAAANPDVLFLIAGDGQYAGYVRGYLRHHRLGHRIRMLGAVRNERMHELLALSDLFFLPSEMEGISLAIFEAMAMRVVPVSADVGGQAELVTPDCGVLIQRGPNEGNAYAQALLKLLRDRAALTRLGAAARQRLQNHFRLDQMGDRMEAVLNRAIELHQTNPRPPVSAEVAADALHRTIAFARQFEMETREAQAARPNWRRRVRQGYWNLVDRGAWWLVPGWERLESLIRK